MTEFSKLSINFSQRVVESECTHYLIILEGYVKLQMFCGPKELLIYYYFSRLFKVSVLFSATPEVNTECLRPVYSIFAFENRMERSLGISNTEQKWEALSAQPVILFVLHLPQFCTS